jgi:ABC-type polysaccharide/polyol phosphate export permease
MAAGMARWAADLSRRRDLLYTLAWREVKVKYKQSVMGFLWAIFMPMVIVGAGLTVRYAAARLAGRSLALDDVVLVSVKAVPWAFVVATIRFASHSLISNANLVTKIYMPREMFPIAAVLAQLVDLALAIAVLVVVMVVIGIPWHASMWWAPVFMLLLIVLVTGLGVFLSAAALFFRDVKYIVEVILTFAIFFTPVFYEVAAFDRWADVLLLNPAAPLLEGIGAAVAGRPLPAPEWIAYSGVVAVGGLVAALAVFKKLEPYFAESV